MSTESERLLIRNLLAGDEQELHSFYHDNRAKLYSFVYGRIPQKHIAEELTQDIFIHFLESARDFRFQSSIKTFLFAIARNKVIDYIRKKKVKQIFFSHMPAFVVDSLVTVVLDEDLDRTALQEKLEQVFSQLPHDYELVLRLKYIEDKSVRQIASQLVRTFKSTESLLFRARKAFIGVYHELS